MQISYREMSLDDYEAAFALWSASEGLDLTKDDSKDRIALYLLRNPLTCFIALQNEIIIGCILCGHDGRRGILRHLCVSNKARGLGIARRLIELCFAALLLCRLKGFKGVIYSCWIVIQQVRHFGRTWLGIRLRIISEPCSL